MSAVLTVGKYFKVVFQLATLDSRVNYTKIITYVNVAGPITISMLNVLFNIGHRENRLSGVAALDDKRKLT